jgi:hypothetical protein
VHRLLPPPLRSGQVVLRRADALPELAGMAAHSPVRIDLMQTRCDVRLAMTSACLAIGISGSAVESQDTRTVLGGYQLDVSSAGRRTPLVHVEPRADARRISLALHAIGADAIRWAPLQDVRRSEHACTARRPNLQTYPLLACWRTLGTPCGSVATQASSRMMERRSRRWHTTPASPPTW